MMFMSHQGDLLSPLLLMMSSYAYLKGSSNTKLQRNFSSHQQIHINYYQIRIKRHTKLSYLTWSKPILARGVF